MRRDVGLGQPYRNARAAGQSAGAVQSVPPTSPAEHSQVVRSNIARFFIDLRRVMKITPYQAASHLVTPVETFEALETGTIERLPSWPETSRIVMAYTSIAGVDGRPVLSAIADEMRLVDQANAARVAAAQRLSQSRFQVERLRQAGTAVANGVRRLPKGAMQQVRERPDRALYAVSLPLGLVLLLLNTTILQSAFSHMPRPIARMAVDVRQFFEVAFAPVHEGLRWIDVDDPRARRGDKLR